MRPDLGVIDSPIRKTRELKVMGVNPHAGSTPITLPTL